MNAQQPVINGRLVDAITDVPLPLVKIAVEGSFVQTFSNSEGFFSLELSTIDKADLILVFSKNGFITKRFPVKFSDVDRELNDISLQPDPFLERAQINSIS
ncbi:MAG: carboxypeptidase-like regulatory domain-containing protein, partial [Christiangramia sp.]